MTASNYATAPRQQKQQMQSFQQNQTFEGFLCRAATFQSITSGRFLLFISVQSVCKHGNGVITM